MSTTSQPAVKGSFILREPVFLESDKEQSLHNQEESPFARLTGLPTDHGPAGWYSG